MRIGTALADRDNAFRKDFCSCVRSLFTADCLERRCGIFRGGARYNAVQHEIVGLTNTANSLAAIRAMVFESRALDLEALVGILDRDFADREDVRRTLLERVPKFGNDDDRVDQLRVEVSRFFYDEVRARPTTLGGFHWPGEVIFSYHADLAPYVGASADGRRALLDGEAAAGPVPDLLLAQRQVHRRRTGTSSYGSEGSAPASPVSSPCCRRRSSGGRGTMWSETGRFPAVVQPCTTAPRHLVPAGPAG